MTNKQIQKPKRELTLNQKRYIQEYVNGEFRGKKTRSVLVAYTKPDGSKPTYKTATVIAAKNTKNKAIQSAIEQALAKKGVTVEKVAEVIAEGLDATKIDYNPKDKEYSDSGLPDHLARAAYIKIWSSLTGAKSPEKHEHLHGVLTLEDIANIQERLQA